MVDREARFNRSSLATKVHRDPARSHGSASSPSRRSRYQSASAVPISLVVNGTLPPVASADLIDLPTAAATIGGTAFPICLNAADGGPEKRKLSGKDWMRAASRTVNVRGWRGWMYQ